MAQNAPIDVRQFANLHAAIQSLREAGCGELFLSAGEYQLDEPILVDQQDIIIRGEGPASVVRMTGDGVPAFRVEASGCTIRNLNVVSANAVLVAVQADSARISNCTFDTSASPPDAASQQV